MMEGSEWTGTGRRDPVLRRSEEEEMACWITSLEWGTQLE